MAISRPMHELLSTVSDRVSVHMPGHKGQTLFEEDPACRFDTTELPVTDDLYAPSGAIAKAQALIAKAAGAAGTIFLTGGATAGIHAMLLASVPSGETVLLPRNAHLSCINACILGDLRPVFVPCEITGDGYAYVPEEGFLKAIREHSEARAVLVTRPDYYGGAISLERIAQAAHVAGMRLLVDEAHGAHFNWMTGMKNAAASGADLWVQSAHKTLPVLTGGAWLHLSETVNADRVLRMLRLVQTSSPPFYLLKSLDDARAYMEACGRQKLEALVQMLADVRAEMKKFGYEDAHIRWRDLPLAFDPTRLVIHAPQGGYVLAEGLLKQGMDVEMADDRRVVCIFSVMDGEETAARLLKALASCARELPEISTFEMHISPAIPPSRMTPRQAALGDTHMVPMERAAGRIAAVSVGIYPPGIPLVTPGEEITPEAAQMILAAPRGNRFGLADGQFLCVME